MSQIAQKLLIGQPVTLRLTDDNITAEKTSATLTIINELAEVVLDSSDAKIENKPCTWDSGYTCTVTIKSDNQEGYYRVFWKVLDGSAIVELESSNTPEVVFAQKLVSTDIELVSVQWFQDSKLNLVPLGEFPLQNVMEIIQSSQADLENDLMIFFSKRLISNERHDYYSQNFRETYWLQKLFHSPVVDIVSMTLMYGDIEIGEVELDNIMLDKVMGTIEIMPSNATQIYTLLASGLSQLGTIGVRNRIPFMFDITYNAGLDWANLSNIEKNQIRQAIGRRTAINLLPILDSAMGLSSYSRSLDGASESKSFTASAMYGQYSAQIEQFQKDDEKFLASFRKKYGKDIVFTIV